MNDVKIKIIRGCLGPIFLSLSITILAILTINEKSIGLFISSARNYLKIIIGSIIAIDFGVLVYYLSLVKEPFGDYLQHKNADRVYFTSFLYVLIIGLVSFFIMFVTMSNYVNLFFLTLFSVETLSNISTLHQVIILYRRFNVLSKDDN